MVDEQPAQQKRRRVTSVDVAAEAGVSQATVARTYSSPERVSADTKQKVYDAAERIGYVPNAIARSLKSQRTNIVGAVVPVHGEYWQSVLSETSQQLAARHRQLLVFSFGDQTDVDQVVASVQQYRLDGLLMASANIGSSQLVPMASAELPVVAFNQPAAANIVDSVSVDNEAGMAEIARHLVDQGAASVLYIGGDSRTSTDQLRYQGAARALGQHRIACPYVAADAFTYEAGYKAGSVIADDAGSDGLPDAIMVAADEVAFGVIDGLRIAGYSVPGDVLVTGFDGLPQASWAGYDLTTLVQPTAELVTHSLELLLDDDTRDDDAAPGRGSVHNIVVEGLLRVGTSSRRPPT